MNDECLFNQQDDHNSSLIVRILCNSKEKAVQMLNTNGVAIPSINKIKTYFQQVEMLSLSRTLMTQQT